MPITETTVAFIGVNGGLASAIAGGNYRILLCENSSEPLHQQIKQQHADDDVQILDKLYCSCWEADIIILANAFGAENRIIDTIYEVTTQKIVLSIDTYPENNTVCALVQNRAEQLQQMLPHSRVVAVTEPPAIKKDYTSDHLKNQADVLFASQDKKAQALASRFIEAAGFNPQPFLYEKETGN